MSNNKDLALVLLKEVRDEQKTHSKILVKMQRDVCINTVDLTEHKLGVQQNRKRIEMLEEPSVAFSVIKKYIIGLGAIAAAVLAIYETIEHL